MIKMLNDNVLVESLDREEQRGGIFLPDEIPSERYDETRCKVIAVGAKCVTGVAVGDECLLAPMKGVKVQRDGDTRLIVKEVELYCVFTKE